MDHRQPVSRSKQLVIYYKDTDGVEKSYAVEDYGQGQYALDTILFHRGQRHKVTRIEELDCVHSVIGREDLTSKYKHLIERWDHTYMQVIAHLDGQDKEVIYVKSIDVNQHELRENIDYATLQLKKKWGANITITQFQPPDPHTLSRGIMNVDL